MITLLTYIQCSCNLPCLLIWRITETEFRVCSFLIVKLSKKMGDYSYIHINLGEN